VQGLVGIRYVHAFFQVSVGQPLRYGRLALHLDGVVGRLTPDVRIPAATPLEGVAGEVIVRHKAERRDDILGKILVLVVTKHQDKVGIKSLDLGPQLAEGVHQPAAVLPVRRDPLILAILFSYPFWPVVGVLECFRHPGITSQSAQEGPGLGLVWLDHSRPVCGPHTHYRSHFVPPCMEQYCIYVWNLRLAPATTLLKRLQLMSPWLQL